MQPAPLECRIILTFRRDCKVDVGMFCPNTHRYEPLGTHGPAVHDVDRVVQDLKKSIERAGHRLTFCERSE